MPVSLNINDILSKVKELEKEDQFTLMERLVALLRRNETVHKPVKLSKISGVGSKIWKKSNIDEYIEQERQW
jgi:hypothetical protein